MERRSFGLPEVSNGRSGQDSAGPTANLRGAMPANDTSTVEVLSTRTDGLLLVPIGPRGIWGALRSVHRTMASLRDTGSSPRTAFVVAMSPDGRIVPGRAHEASVFVVGYRLTGQD
jgi:hypothetical protein